jgi:multiple sugar transport system permease protein
MAAEAPRPKPVGSGTRRRDARTAFWFLLPSLLGFLAFMLYPLLASFGMSFTNWQIMGVPKFIGIDNYIRLFTKDRTFYATLFNTLFYTVEYLVLNIVISLGLALWIATIRRGQKWFRVIFFLPTFTPVVASSVVWVLIFTPNGLLDYIFASLSIPFPNLLLDPNWSMQAIIIVSLWAGVGYNLVLFGAALSLVPQSYLDAAQIDGANAWQRFWMIRLPLISPTVFFASVMTVISSLQVFDAIYAITRGGPGSATQTLGYSIYQFGFVRYLMGYATTISWVMFAIIMGFTALQFYLQKKWVTYDA